MSIFSERTSTLMHQYGLNQKDLAKMAGVTAVSYTHLPRFAVPAPPVQWPGAPGQNRTPWTWASYSSYPCQRAQMCIRDRSKDRLRVIFPKKVFRTGGRLGGMLFLSLIHI